MMKEWWRVKKNDEGQWRASVRVQKKKWRASNVMMKIKKRYTKCWCDEELKWWRIEFDEEFKQWRSLPLLIHRFCFFKNSNQVLLGVFEYNLLRFASDQTWPHSCLARYSINETFFSIHYVCIYLSIYLSIYLYRFVQVKDCKKLVEPFEFASYIVSLFGVGNCMKLLLFWLDFYLILL